jgi:hypothetical protein
MTKQVTNGELQTFKQCRRKWWLGWYRRLRPLQPEVVGPAPLGTRIHKALEAYYSPTSTNPYEVLAAGIQEDAARLADDVDAVAELRKEGELAQIMLEGYFQWLGETGSDQGLSIVAAESKIVVPFPAFPDGSVELMGKLDLRIQREQDGARLFLDHKTVGSFNEATKTLAMNEQMLHYHLLEYLDYLQAMGPEEAGMAPLTDGGLYNMLRKVKRTARATPPFYERVEVRHNRKELQSYYMRVFGEVTEILRTEARLAAGEHPGMVAYPTPTRDCSWKCEFYGVCPIFDDNPEAAEQFVADWFEPRDPLDRYDASVEPTA